MSNSFKKLNKNSYDDLSSFLEDDELDFHENKSIKTEDESLDNNENSESKSLFSEDLATRKARIIEGTNFDISLKKSKKSKKKSKK